MRIPVPFLVEFLAEDSAVVFPKPVKLSAIIKK